jgi:DNA invertase Pin-like site-specific DNA recombinase
MSNQIVGYIRVSSQGQNTARQLAGLKLDKEFVDMVTGSNQDREGLKECMAYVREGDQLVVDSIDRLARNLQDLQEIVDKLIKKGVSVRFIKENLTFNAHKDPIATLTLQIMGAFAEFERTMIRSRQREGINAAKKAGKHLGRPNKVNSKFIKEAKEKFENKQSIRSIAKDMNVSRATIYKALEL